MASRFSSLSFCYAFGRAVQRARQARGWSTKELGQLIGATHFHVADIEGGRRTVSFEEALRIIQHLDLSIDEFREHLAA